MAAWPPLTRRCGPPQAPPTDLTSAAGSRLAEADLRDTVLRLADDGPVTNGLVRERLGPDRSEALRILKELVADGQEDTHALPDAA